MSAGFQPATIGFAALSNVIGNVENVCSRLMALSLKWEFSKAISDSLGFIPGG